MDNIDETLDSFGGHSVREAVKSLLPLITESGEFPGYCRGSIFLGVVTVDINEGELGPIV